MIAREELSRPDDGFTLLELLVTLTLLALLSAALLGGIRYGTQIWTRSESAATDDNHARAVQADLADAMEHIYPAFVATIRTGFVDFDGRADRISFLAPDRALPGSLARIVIGTDPGDASQLVYASRLELAPDQQPKKRILASVLTALAFTYYGPADSRSAPGWHTSWQNKATLPLLIRMHVTLAGARPWPDLTVAPRIMADVNCVYDPVTKYCQGR